MLEKFFHLKENHTDVKTEIMAGITTFMTMAYILAVNPQHPVRSRHGFPKAVLIATALASFIATALMAVLANYPLCPGSRHGPERLLCLHGRADHGLQLAAGSDGRLC